MKTIIVTVALLLAIGVGTVIAQVMGGQSGIGVGIRSSGGGGGGGGGGCVGAADMSDGCAIAVFGH